MATALATPVASINAYELPDGYVTNSDDCDDSKVIYTDSDGDGFGAGDPVACGVADNTDCNDEDATFTRHKPTTTMATRTAMAMAATPYRCALLPHPTAM